MNRDYLKQIMIDQKETYLNNPMMKERLSIGRQCKLLLCWN